MILAKLKDFDIAARPQGDRPPFPTTRSYRDATRHGEIAPRERSISSEQGGNRPELAEKEEAEIARDRRHSCRKADGLRPRSPLLSTKPCRRDRSGTGLKDMGKRDGSAESPRTAPTLDMGRAGTVGQSPPQPGVGPNRWRCRPSSSTSCAPARRCTALVGASGQAQPSRAVTGKAAAPSMARRRRVSTSTRTTSTASAAARTATPSPSTMQSFRRLLHRSESRCLAAEAGLEVPRPSPGRRPKPSSRRLDLHRRAGSARSPVSSAACTSARGRGGARLPPAPRPVRRHHRPLRPRLERRRPRQPQRRLEMRRGRSRPIAALEAGLLRPDDGQRLPARTSSGHRVTFPIRDRRGSRHQLRRPRGLGDGEAQVPQRPRNPYLSKSAARLYGLRLGPRAGTARPALLIVVEGYMDVIALHQAGFDAAVAPLGTALTDEQLEELWRLSPESRCCASTATPPGASAAASRAMDAGTADADARTLPRLRHPAVRPGPRQPRPRGRGRSIPIAARCQAAARGRRCSPSSAKAPATLPGSPRRPARPPRGRGCPQSLDRAYRAGVTATPCATGSTRRAAQAAANKPAPVARSSGPARRGPAGVFRRRCCTRTARRAMILTAILLRHPASAARRSSRGAIPTALPCRRTLARLRSATKMSAAMRRTPRLTQPSDWFPT